MTRSVSLDEAFDRFMSSLVGFAVTIGISSVRLMTVPVSESWGTTSSSSSSNSSISVLLAVSSLAPSFNSFSTLSEYVFSRTVSDATLFHRCLGCIRLRNTTIVSSVR